MKKVFTFLKNQFKRFCTDKKFNNVVMALVELPLLIIGFIKSNYALILWGVIGLAIFNAIIKKVYQLILVKKMKAFIIENSKKGVDKVNVN